MDRLEFMKLCSMLGIGLAMPAGMAACGDDDDNNGSGFNGKVTIIGAGAAGLTAGYLLNQQGVDFEILEASSVYGGRMRRTTDFANFPIPLGAEWLHVERGVLNEIVNDPSIQVSVATTPYDPSVDFGLLNGQQISVADVGFTIDQKFINATWFDFFDQYVVPSVAGRITYNTVVQSIDYSGDQVVIGTANNEYRADRVIVAVPVKILQNGVITFTPALPANKQDAIDNVTVWDGCKAFIEFSEKFYPTFTAFEIVPEEAGQKLYYDAAYGQNTTQHILGLFAVGTGATPYLQRTGDELINYMLAELDLLYNGQASANYVKHIFQNWNEEPFANGAYVYDYEDWRRLRTLGEPVGDKLLFAGDAYTTGEDWSSVHTAARSAIRAVAAITA